MAGFCTFLAQGRYGNFMMEFFTAFAYSLKYGLDFTVPAKATHEFYNPVYLPHLINPSYNPHKERVMIVEKHFHYYELPFEESWRDKNIILHGYFQSERHFKDYRKEILQAVNYPNEMKKGVVGVHIRRGDYLIHRNKHPEVTKEWYENAMSNFLGYKFLFFSDDIPWCIENFGHRSDCEFSKGGIEEDAISLSQCEHFVNSSSTYSWVCAWLSQNPDKIIYTPKNWFVEGWQNEDTKDIVPPEWIKL